jgi:UDP:flavonoid glycosyltransferase YjiC (YdhE family)
LSLGVPVVVLPMGADQPDNADRCEELGVGIVLNALTAEPETISTAVRAVTTEPRYHDAAAALAAEAASQPSIDELDELRVMLDRA